MTMDPRRLYGEIVELEKQLRELLRSNPLNAQDANALRGRLMDKAKILTEVSPAFAASKEIEQVLWKPCFYKRIEDFRRRIRKYASASSSDRSIREHFSRVSTEFQQFLTESAAFYDHLRESFTKWLQTNRASRIMPPVSGGSASPLSPNLMANIARCRQSLHRCFVFLGDLARYRELHSHKAKKNFAAAESFYHKALALIPDNGNPHNQLAVLATYVEAETVAVYRYCRSLLIAQPFATAEENLALLFERSRQRPLAAPLSIELVASSPSKEKSAFLKSFLHRLTKMHGILFSLATRPSKSGRSDGPGFGPSATLDYPRDMEAVLVRDLSTLLRAGVIGDALLLKVVVTNIFCTVRFFTGNTAASEDSLRLSVLIINDVVDFLLEELNNSSQSGNFVESSSGMRLLGPVSIFCDFLRWNPTYLDEFEKAASRSKDSEDYPITAFAPKFLDSLVSFLNHSTVKGFYSTFVTLSTEQQQSLRGKQLLLKENVELRGFSPLSGSFEKFPNWNDDVALGGAKANGAGASLAENEAVKIRAWKIYQFGRFLAEGYEGNPLLFFNNGQFATSPVIGEGSSNNGYLTAVMATSQRSESSSRESSQVPSFNLGLFGAPARDEPIAFGSMTPAKSRGNDDDDIDDEVIVFQPSTVHIGHSNNGALGGNVNTIAGTSTPIRSSFPITAGSDSFGLGSTSSSNINNDPFGRFSNGSIGSTLGYPNFHTFSDFSSFSGQGLLSGWGNSNINNLDNPTAPGFPTSSSFDLGNNDGRPFAPMLDLDAVERESTLYQREKSSLSAFLSSSPQSNIGMSPSVPLRTSPLPPPPPGFSKSSLGGVPENDERSPDVPLTRFPQQSQFFTRNPFINP